MQRHSVRSPSPTESPVSSHIGAAKSTSSLPPEGFLRKATKGFPVLVQGEPQIFQERLLQLIIGLCDRWGNNYCGKQLKPSLITAKSACLPTLSSGSLLPASSSQIVIDMPQVSHHLAMDLITPPSFANVIAHCVHLS